MMDSIKANVPGGFGKRRPTPSNEVSVPYMMPFSAALQYNTSIRQGAHTNSISLSQAAGRNEVCTLTHMPPTQNPSHSFSYTHTHSLSLSPACTLAHMQVAVPA
jgi:hypothetical protein